jgi:ferritin-like metal-binding protein YciE
MQELFVQELKDLYSAESQLVKALPKMAKGATNPELRQAFEMHLEETKAQQQRIEEIFESEKLNGSPRGHKCKGMEGLLEEGSEMLEEDGEENVIDAGLIGAAQRVEHYEIAGYGTAHALAELLGLSKAARLLEQSLKEEEATDKKLTQIAEQYVYAAAPQSQVGG